MPTYQYRCSECGDELEAVQKFTDPALTECPVCEGRLRKVFNAVGVVFKGSGFYRTDSRAEKKSTGADSSSGATSEGSSPEKKSSESTDKKPAESTTTSSGSKTSGSKQPVGAGSASGGSSTAA